ncbi:hypothetical protein IIW_00319 [Bacillus cereus VD136]|nr:hypothetical protein IIW_00319 [Bacillus cereus VD136]
MTNLKVTIEVIDNKEERDNLVNRVEVLERVKELLLLPGMEKATTQQVADFYNVPLKTVRSLVNYHQDEFEIDGCISIKGKEIRKTLEGLKTNPSKIEPKQGHFLVDGLKVTYSNNDLFPKRAILRVGMLLRNSEVAKEVRTQLLNIEENTAQPVKTQEIDHEMELQIKVGKAVSSGDIVELISAMKELEDYKNRHVFEKARKYDKYLEKDGTMTVTMMASAIKFATLISSIK